MTTIFAMTVFTADTTPPPVSPSIRHWLTEETTHNVCTNTSSYRYHTATANANSWADPITLFGFYDWMAKEDVGQVYYSWEEPLELPPCSAHNYKAGLIYLGHKVGVEVYPRIGGWSLSDLFPVMAVNAEASKNFVSQCVNLTRNYNFDGIDLGE